MNLSYHDIRHKLISHISELEGFAKEIESEMVDVRAQLPSDRPIVISLVGNRDAGMHQVVGRTLALDIPERGEGCDYHCIHYPDCPPILLEGIPDVNFSTHDSDALKKWIMVEYYTKPVTGLAPVNEVVNKSDAIVFVVDARDPWSGRIWNHFENYVKSHQGRIFFFLNRLEKIDQRDWSILKKHLEEKILQVAGYSIKIKLSEDDSSFIDLCDALDSTEINRVKWDELKPMTMVLTQAMGDIEATLQENLIWQANAASFSEELDSDLSKLNQQLDSRMEHSIEEAGKSLSERATEIVAGVRKTFTNRAYFRSFVKNSVSLDSFYSNLEKVVSETLYRELTGCYSLINSCVTKHARDFKEDYKQLALQLTKFQGEFDNINVPFILCKDDVQQEVHKTMLEWDVKKIFEEQLAAIDRVANFRIKIALVLMIAAGLLGALGQNWIAFIPLTVGVIFIPITLWLRKRAIKRFCDFLHEWFIGFGPRMQKPAEYLGKKIVDHAISFYREFFIKVLDRVNKREKEMPARFVKAHDLTEKNKEMVGTLLHG